MKPRLLLPKGPLQLPPAWLAAHGPHADITVHNPNYVVQLTSMTLYFLDDAQRVHYDVSVSR